MRIRNLVLLIFATALVVYTLKGIYTLDSDFGWHIRMGQIIMQKGIPDTDPFSYTMPSYPFVDHEWLTNSFIALLYPIAGMPLLSILFAVLAVIASYMQIPKKLYQWSALPLILIYTALFPIAGVRTQVISWFLFSIIIQLFYRIDKNKYTPIIIIFLILLWTNLHGSFPIAIVLIFIFFVSRWYLHKKTNASELVLLIGSVLITLLNPYGYRIWWEIGMQMTDHSLRWSIVEWFPAFMFINISLWSYVVISVMLVYRFRHHFTLYEKMTYCLLLVAGISSFRHIPFWMIFSLIPTLQSMKYFHEEIKNYNDGERRLNIFFNMLLLLAVFCCIWEIGWYAWGTSTFSEKKYPAKAVLYLKKNPPAGEIFSLYEWGGYLDWKLPEKKIFIDGRMPSFRWMARNKKESNYAFKEYQQLLYDKKTPADSLIKKYNITTILIRKPPLESTDPFTIWIQKAIGLYIPVKNKKSTRLPILNHVKEIYSDDVSILYTIIK